ncbi:MAG: endonuclease III [Bdellovibrionales bacterium]|nr:endonuclease III [Bdellovibrionales bacterium]
MQKKETEALIRLLNKYYPNPQCALNYSSPGELLIATILSAQCTDERVNAVTKKLFIKYPTMQAFAKVKQSELEKDIHSTGFYKNKARNIISCAKTLVDQYDGEVPQSLDALVALAGVGRKTANVVLGNAFNIASGVVVDTHVTRLSHRLNLTQAKTAEKIEQDLNKIVPKKHWIRFSHWLILHGRQVCKARKPACMTCFLDDMCPKRI